MPRSLREVMSGKSEEGLMDYLINFKRYTSDAIAAAVDELKRRGRVFTDEDLKEISLKIESRKNADDEDDNPFMPSDSWTKNVVTDSNAPLLYSKGTIRAFSLLFSTIFGAVLLSSNITDSKRKWIVISFGIIYTSLTIVIVNSVPSNTSGYSCLTRLAGLDLHRLFGTNLLERR